MDASIIVAIITVIGALAGTIITNIFNSNKKQDALIAKVNETIDTKLAISNEKINQVAETTNKKIEALEERIIATRLKEVEELKQSDKIAKEGIQAILRDRLLQLYRYCTELRCKGNIKKAYSTDDEKKNFENMYQKYHSLGENGVMTVKFDHFMELPDYEPVTAAKTSKRKSRSTKEAE